MLTTWQLNELSESFMPADRRLWDALVTQAPISITMLFRMRYTDADANEFDLRRKQQYIGARISVMNKALQPYGLEIATGSPRYTYQLRDIVPA